MHVHSLRCSGHSSCIIRFMLVCFICIMECIYSLIWQFFIWLQPCSVRVFHSLSVGDGFVQERGSSNQYRRYGRCARSGRGWRYAAAKHNAWSAVQCVDGESADSGEHKESRVEESVHHHHWVLSQEPLLLSGTFDYAQKPWILGSVFLSVDHKNSVNTRCGW